MKSPLYNKSARRRLIVHVSRTIKQKNQDDEVQREINEVVPWKK